MNDAHAPNVVRDGPPMLLAWSAGHVRATWHHARAPGHVPAGNVAPGAQVCRGEHAPRATIPCSHAYQSASRTSSHALFGVCRRRACGKRPAVRRRLGAVSRQKRLFPEARPESLC